MKKAKKETVDKIMTKKVFSIEKDRSLHEAEKLFHKHHIRHLPVTSEGKLAGMLSRTDIMRLSFGDTYGTEEDDVDSTLFDMLSIDDIMTHHPTVISPDDTIEQAAQFLVDEEFHAAPVADGDELKGIVTTTDVIRYQLNKIRDLEK